MNNLGLVDYAKKALAEKWGYVWGTFGQVLTPDLFAMKVRQYPDGVGQYFDFIKSHWVGRKTTDCVGLIKGYYWGEGNYVAATDESADSMLAKAKEKGDISTIPDIPGICVQKAGHIGVYIGGGQVIEAHGTMYGVIQTPLKGGTPWTSWLKCPYLDYGTSVPTPQAIKINPRTLELQNVLNRMGVTDKAGSKLVEDGLLGSKTMEALNKITIARGMRSPIVGFVQKLVGADVDNNYGNPPWRDTYDAICWFQKKNGLTQDGVVGPNTWAKIAQIYLA